MIAARRCSRVRSAQGGTRQSHRTSAVRRRHDAAEHALRRDRSQPDSARQNPEHHLWAGNRVGRICRRHREGHPRARIVIALIADDQPCLADGVVNHPEEPILLLAHPDRHLLPKAVAAVSIEYDPLPAVFTMEESESRSPNHLGRGQYVQDLSESKKAMSMRSGRRPTTSSKANTAPARRSSFTSKITE